MGTGVNTGFASQADGKVVQDQGPRPSEISFLPCRQVRPMLHIGVNCVLRFLLIVFVQKSLDAGAILRMDITEVLNRFLLDKKLCVFQMARNVLTQAFPLLLIQYFQIEIPHLSDIVIAGTVEALYIPRKAGPMF